MKPRSNSGSAHPAFNPLLHALPAQCDEEVSYLLIHLVGAGYRLGNLGPDQLPQPAAKPMHDDLGRSLGHAQCGGNLVIRRRIAVHGDVPLEMLEMLRLAGFSVLCLELFIGAADHRQGPGFLEQRIRRQLAAQLQRVATLRLLDFQRQNSLAPAPLLAMRSTPVVGQEMPQRQQQERPELALGGIDVLQLVLFEQVCEERLCTILRPVSVVAASAEVGVQGKPVGLAQ